MSISQTDLKAKIIQLGPWHLDVQVTPEISTSAFLDAPSNLYSQELGNVNFQNPKKEFDNLLERIYPLGLKNRTFLDCACNCGGYCFWAKEKGASKCFGFDVREHWIKQAQFLSKHRAWPSKGIQFKKHDLYDLPKLGLKPFDITLFKGIFYHLPDPITGLKIAADLTKEILILNTDIDESFPDGMLKVSNESETNIMSGVYGLKWFPTGPLVLIQILNWLGFSETRVIYWMHDTNENRPKRGRLEIVAARNKDILMHYDSRIPKSREQIS